jgi:serine/threonine protein phosphatase PrpC
VNRAGSCGLAIMIIDDDIYVINVGDSRAVLSRN